VPASPDQPPQQPSPDSTPAEVEPSASARLLDEIRERLERLEGSLSLRERRVARVERSLREAEARLQAERARYAAQREELETGLPQQLRQREQQLESAAHARQELEKRLAAQLAREHEALATIEKLTQQRDKAVADLEKARRDIREVQRSHHELECQLEDLNRRRGAWEQSISTGQSVPAAPNAAAAEVPQWFLPALRLAQGWRKLTPTRRAALTVTLLILPITCALAAVSTYRHYPRTYRIEAHIAAPSDHATGARIPFRTPFDGIDALAAFERRPADPAAAPAFDRLEIRRQESAPLLVATMLVRDRERGLNEVNAETARMTDALRHPPAATQSAARADRQALRAQLQADRDRITSRMAALTTRPADGPADPAALLAGWQKTLDERRALDASIAALDVQLQQKPPEPSDIELLPRQLPTAIAADPRLQADSDMLAQRESRLADALRQTLTAAGPAFTDLAQTAATADRHIEELLAASHDQDVTESIQAVRNALSNCAKAGATVARTWQNERRALDAATPASPGTPGTSGLPAAPTGLAAPGAATTLSAPGAEPAAGGTPNAPGTPSNIAATHPNAATKPSNTHAPSSAAGAPPAITAAGAAILPGAATATAIAAATGAAADTDVAARYKAVETAARDFLDSTRNSLGLIQKSLDAIGQGGDEPTKRLVLRNSLAQRIQPALDAREALAAAVRQVTAAENIELATLAEGVGGLRVQVQTRRARLEQDLRDQLLADTRAAYERNMQQLRAQRDDLARKAAALESAIVKSAAEALSLLGGSQGREAALSDWLQLARTRSDLTARLAALDRADAEDAAQTDRLTNLAWSDAAAIDVTPRPSLAAWTTAAAAAPLALFAFVLALFAAVRALRHPPGSLDEYTKALTAAPPKKKKGSGVF
jgi:hypothetical protein